MMDGNGAVLIQFEELSLFRDEIGRVPHVSEKMLVDLVNGSNDVCDLVAAKKQEGFFMRMKGGLDGSSRRREIIIQEQTQHSIEVLTSWALDMTESVSFTQESLIMLIGKVQDTRGDLLKVAKVVCQNNQQIENITLSLKALENRLSQRLDETERRLLTVEDKQVILEITEAWESGRFYDGYPPAAQLAFVIDELIRGERGRRILANEEAAGFMYDRIVNVCGKKAGAGAAKSRTLTMHWLPELGHSDPVKSEMMSYGIRGRQHAFLHNAIACYAGTQSEPAWLKKEQINGNVPELMDVKDFACELVRENAIGLTRRMEYV